MLQSALRSELALWLRNGPTPGLWEPDLRELPYLSLDEMQTQLGLRFKFHGMITTQHKVYNWLEEMSARG